MFKNLSFQWCAAHAALLASSLWGGTLHAGSPDCECAGRPKNNYFWQHRLPPVGRDCKCETPMGTECSAPPQGPFFGYFPTCWHRWPQPWQPCPTTEWESCQLGRAGHDGVVVPVQELPAGIPTPPTATVPAAESAPSPPTPAPGDGSHRSPSRPQVDGEKAAQAPAPAVLQSSSRRAAGPLAAVALASEPKNAQPKSTEPKVAEPTISEPMSPEPQIAATAKVSSHPTQPAAPKVATVAAPPEAPQQPPVVEESPLNLEPTAQTTSAAAVSQEPKAHSVLVKPAIAKKPVAPTVDTRVAAASVAVPAARSIEKSVPARTVAIEGKPASKAASASAVGSRYREADVAADSNPAPAAPVKAQSNAQPNPLRSRSSRMTAELANSNSNNPLRR